MCHHGSHPTFKVDVNVHIAFLCSWNTPALHIPYPDHPTARTVADFTVDVESAFKEAG